MYAVRARITICGQTRTKPMLNATWPMAPAHIDREFLDRTDIPFRSHFLSQGTTTTRQQSWTNQTHHTQRDI